MALMRNLLVAGLLVLGAPGRSWAQAPAPTFQLSGNVLTLPAPLSFRAGTAELLPASEPALQYIRQYLEAKTYISQLRIEGHAPEGAAGQALSEKRALAVAGWLVAHGVDCQRLLPVGFGGSKPVAAGAAEANTRVEVVNVALRGHLIGGLPADGGGRVAGDACHP